MDKIFLFAVFLLLVVTPGFAKKPPHDLKKPQRPQMSFWRLVVADGGFRRRDDSKVFPFHNKIIMSQGFDVGNVHLKDVLVSTSPGKFKRVNTNVPYGIYAPIAVHNNWVYIVDSVLRKTQDFIKYTTITVKGSAPGLKPTRYLKSLNGKLYLIDANNIWSIDPEAHIPTWTITNLPWYNGPERGFSAVEVFKNRLVIVAGAYRTPNTPNRERGYNFTSLNDVWSSDNPEDTSSWVEHTAYAPFAPRMWPSIVTKGPWLYISGGYNNILGSPNNFNDTWRTRDLDHWELVRVGAAYPARHAPSLYVQNDDIYLVAGNTNRGLSTQKDVWKLTLK